MLIVSLSDSQGLLAGLERPRRGGLARRVGRRRPHRGGYTPPHRRLATIAFDLIVAVEIGVAVASLLALRQVARNALAVPEGVAASDAVTPDDDDERLSEHILTYRLDGALFFGGAQRILAEPTAVRGVCVVILRLPDLQVLDATGAQALGEIVQQLEARGITVLIKGPRPEHLRVLEAVGVLDRLAHEPHLFDNLDAALSHARSHAARAEIDAA